MGTIEKLINDTLAESLSTKSEFWRTEQENFFRIADVLFQCVSQNHKILICGNGGSACDALHFAGELVNRYSRNRRALSCVALTADAPLISCIANDFDFESVFSRQVEAHARSGDVLIAISTSGNSKNIVKALSAAKRAGIQSVALLGGNGGVISNEQLADHTLQVSSSRSTPRIQETHSWILHSFCEYIDFKLVGP